MNRKRMVQSALSWAVLMSAACMVWAQKDAPMSGAQDKGFAQDNTLVKAVADGGAGGLSAQQASPGGAISGSFQVTGTLLSMVRIHVAGADQTAACYLDLSKTAGSKTFSFNGAGWTSENGRSCASALPANGAPGLVFFKLEVRDKAQALVEPAVWRSVSYAGKVVAPPVPTVTPAATSAPLPAPVPAPKPQMLSFTVQQPAADQPITGTLNVSDNVRLLRVHATKSPTGPSACFLDLRPLAGAQSFSFAGNWQNNPSSTVTCASLLPQPGGQSILLFKAEVVGADGTQLLVNGLAPQVGATYKVNAQVAPIKVTGVSPLHVALNCPDTKPTPVTFTVAGSNLPASLVIDVPGALCRNDAKPSGNQVTCEVNANSASVIVKDKPQAQGGGQIASFPLVIQTPVCSVATGSFSNINPDPFQIWKEWQSGPAKVNTPELRDGNVYKLSPAQIIFYAAKENDMNPVFLLTKLQHEKGLISTGYLDSDSLTVALNHATGYGSYGDDPRNPKWAGFYPQVVATAYQFGAVMRQTRDFEMQLKTYSKDVTAVSTIKTVYAQYASVMNGIVGKNYGPSPTGWAYATDFRDISAQHIQAFLDRYPGHLRNTKLFFGSGSNIDVRVDSSQATVSPPLASLYVTQNFGAYLGTYAGIAYNGYHPGTDFRGASGTPVKAIADGEVTRVASAIPGNAGALGWYIIVNHPSLNVRSVYVHTAPPQVAVGQQVKAGQQIAVLAKPAWVPSHLHLEVQRGNSRVVDSKGSPVSFVGRYTTPKGNRGYVIKLAELNSVWLDPLKFISGNGALAKGDAVPAVMPVVVQEPLDLTTHNFVMVPQTDDPDISSQISRQQVLNQVMSLGVSKGLAKDTSMAEAQRLGIFQGATLARPTESASRMEVALMVQRLVQSANLPQVAQGTRFTVEEFGSTPEASEQDYLGVTNRLYQWGVVTGQQDHLGDWRYYPTRKASAFELGEVMQRLEQVVPVKQMVIASPIDDVKPPVDRVTPPLITAVSVSVSNLTPSVGELVQVNVDGTLAKGPVDIYLYLKVEQLGGAIAWYYDRGLHDEQGERKPWRASVMGPTLPETNPIFQYTTRVPGNYVVGVLVMPAGSPVNMLNAVETSFTVH